MYIRFVDTFCIFALHMRSVYTLGDTNGRMNGRIGEQRIRASRDIHGGWRCAGIGIMSLFPTASMLIEIRRCCRDLVNFLPLQVSILCRVEPFVMWFYLAQLNDILAKATYRPSRHVQDNQTNLGIHRLGCCLSASPGAGALVFHCRLFHAPSVAHFLGCSLFQSRGRSIL